MEVLIVFAERLENVLDNRSRIKVEQENLLLLNELLASYSFNEQDNVKYFSSNSVLKQDQPNQIREALIKGYVEMSHINLTICTECQYAEYEAQHTTERLVSGG